MSGETTKPTLLARVRDPSDSDAWREFDAIYRPVLVRFACSRGLGLEQAEEVAQECLFRLSQRMASFEYDPSKGRFRGWLKTIVIRLVIDSRQKLRPRTAESAILRNATDSAENPERAYERLELQGLVWNCLERIRESLRGEQTYEVFCRRVMDGWSVERICREYDVTRNQVDGIKFRVGRMIGKMVVELFGDEGLTSPDVRP